MQKQVTFVLGVTAILIAATAFYATAPASRFSQEPASVPKSADERLHTGVIEGRVLDAKGVAVGGAKVFAERDDALNSLVMTSRSDANGYFKVYLREPGTYRVYGSKEEDGYPLTISSFYQENATPSPKVKVSPNQVAQDVTVWLRAKASTITGHIADASTNTPITEATITLRRADNPEAYYLIGANEVKENGKFKVLVPSAPFTIEVSAPGYEPWSHGKDGSGGQADSLRLNQGEIRNLNISLHKKK